MRNNNLSKSTAFKLKQDQKDNKTKTHSLINYPDIKSCCNFWTEKLWDTITQIIPSLESLSSEAANKVGFDKCFSSHYVVQGLRNPFMQSIYKSMWGPSNLKTSLSIKKECIFLIKVQVIDINYTRSFNSRDSYR